MTTQTESRRALRELIDLLSEVDERWASPEWRLTSEADVVGAHRALMHILEGGLDGVFESDPSRPDFRRIVSPSRKFTGDNADAVYYDAPISGDREYIVRGNLDDAVYIAITLEVGSEDGSMPSRTAGVINDAQLDIAADGALRTLGGDSRPDTPSDAAARRTRTLALAKETMGELETLGSG